MLGLVEIKSISSLPAGRQGGRGQSPALSNGVCFQTYLSATLITAIASISISAFLGSFDTSTVDLAGGKDGK